MNKLLCLPLILLPTVLAAHVQKTFGTHVAANGHALRVRALGSGSPCVVFELPGIAPLEGWSPVQARVAGFTRTFAYDHAGYWGSEEGPKPRDARAIASDLRAALERAGIPPPYVLVGGSFGGPLVRVFASTYPNDVAGMVLLDPTQEEFISTLRQRHPGINVASAEDVAAGNEWGCSEASLRQASATDPLPPMPLTLLTANGNPDRKPFLAELLPIKLAEHRRWITRYPQARHVTEDCGHAVQIDRPELCVDLIRDIVTDVRARDRAPGGTSPSLGR
jgi:pimeloyl-ACP methyl ester carboxylesterase